MDTTRLFHLHYHVPNPDETTQTLAELGIPLYRRFGRVDGESVALTPGEQQPDGFRLRLQNAQRGYVNITMTPGNAVQFDHLGIITTEFDQIIETAEQTNGWQVTSTTPHRTFLVTPWGFRIEIHQEGGHVESTLGSWEDCHFEAVTLAVPPAECAVVQASLDTVVGDIPGLTVEPDDGNDVGVPEATIAGGDVLDERVIRSEDLA